MEQAEVKSTQRIPTLVGAVVLGVLAGIGIMWIGQSTFDEYAEEADYNVRVVKPHKPITAEACIAGAACQGPTISAEDPEGDQLVYKFYDKTTNELVADPITSESGAPVTPTFTFKESGEKQLYMVVEDGAGHTSADYPIIIPVEDKK